MQRMNRASRSVAAALAFGGCLALPAGAQGPGPLALVVDASPQRPVFAGGVSATARQRGERAEMLVLVSPGHTVDENRAATAALETTLRSAFPRNTVASQFSTYVEPDGLHMISQTVSGGEARVEFPGPLDDVTLRASVDRAREALSAIPRGAPDAFARIYDVVLGASCESMQQTGDADALAIVRGMARTLGDATATGTALADRTWRSNSSSPDLLCTADTHVRLASRTRSLLPTTTLAVARRAYAFERPLALPLRVPPAPELAVPNGVGAFGDARIRVTADTPVLTVGGFAPAHVHYAGGRYIWSGPNGRYFPSELTAKGLNAVRDRLHAIGVRDEAIVTQLEPDGGRYWVEVRVSQTAPRDDVVTAIAGNEPRERDEVRFLRDRAQCAPESADVRAAVADAAARASALAARLGTRIDVARPVAIDLVTREVQPCVTRETAPYDDRIEWHLDGSLEVPHDDATVAVTVTFAIGAVDLGGGSVHGPPEPAIDQNVVRYLLAPPPIDYPAASSSSDARVDLVLPATDLVVRGQLYPDERTTFVDVGVAATDAFAARIGATPATWSRSIVSGPTASNEPRSLRRNVVALVPARPSAIDDIVAALRDAQQRGGASVDVTPVRRSCSAVPVDLAVRAIRDAAAGANRANGARLVAIDAVGPFAIAGHCGTALTPYYGMDPRQATAALRFAAYARVSYAH
jgi:hypothetical protein